VQHELAIVLQSLQTLSQLPQPTTGQQASTGQQQTSDAVDPAVIWPMLQQLQNLIADNDTAAVDLAEQLEPLLAGTACQSVLAELCKQINQYDFDEAAAVFVTLQHQFEQQN
jgi:hypothetical protein